MSELTVDWARLRSEIEAGIEPEAFDVVLARSRRRTRRRHAAAGGGAVLTAGIVAAIALLQPWTSVRPAGRPDAHSASTCPDPHPPRVEKLANNASAFISGTAEPAGPDFVGPLQLTSLPRGAHPSSGCVNIDDGGSSTAYGRIYRVGTPPAPGWRAINVSDEPAGDISAATGANARVVETNYGSITISDSGDLKTLGFPSRVTSLTINQTWISIGMEGAGTRSDVDAEIVSIVNGLRVQTDPGSVP